MNQLDRANQSTNVRQDDLDKLTGANDTAAKTILDEYSKKHLERIIQDTELLPTAWRALRRSERVVWWPRIWSGIRFGSRRQGRWIAVSAKLSEDPTQGAVNNASDRRSWWQLSYNLACNSAKQEPPAHEDALRWLETSLERRGSEQMTAKWLNRDPDLKNVRTDARFRWVLAQTSDREA